MSERSSGSREGRENDQFILLFDQIRPHLRPDIHTQAIPEGFDRLAHYGQATYELHEEEQNLDSDAASMLYHPPTVHQPSSSAANDAGQPFIQQPSSAPQSPGAENLTAEDNSSSLNVDVRSYLNSSLTSNPHCQSASGFSNVGMNQPSRGNLQPISSPYEWGALERELGSGYNTVVTKCLKSFFGTPLVTRANYFANKCLYYCNGDLKCYICKETGGLENFTHSDDCKVKRSLQPSNGSEIHVRGQETNGIHGDQRANIPRSASSSAARGQAMPPSEAPRRPVEGPIGGMTRATGRALVKSGSGDQEPCLPPTLTFTGDQTRVKVKRSTVDGFEQDKRKPADMPCNGNNPLPTGYIGPRSLNEISSTGHCSTLGYQTALAGHSLPTPRVPDLCIEKMKEMGYEEAQIQGAIQKFDKENGRRNVTVEELVEIIGNLSTDDRQEKKMNPSICKGCNREVVSCSQSTCGHVVCSKCVAKRVGDPCKICQCEVEEVAQFDPSMRK